MKVKGIIAGITGAALIVCSGLIMSAFITGAKSFSTDPAGYRNISEDVEASGDVHGEESMTYYSDVTAPVDRYDLKIGDEVKKGDLTVGYDLSDLVRMRDQAELSAKSAENTMNGQVQASNTNQAKYNKAVSDIDIYRNTYALFRQANDYINQGQYQENWDVNCIAAGLNKELAQRTADLNNKNIELSQAQALFDERAAARIIDEIEEINNDIADLNSDIASLPPTNLPPEEYAATVLNGNWMSDIMRNWTETSTLRNTYENQILNSYQKEQLRNSYDLSALSVESAEEDLAKASGGVHAQYDGIVTKSFIECGSVVTKGSPLFTVESTDRIKVDVGISKYDIGKISVGQKADITIAGNTYSGTVTSINRLAQATDSDKAKVNVAVSFDDPDEKVYIGLEADVAIHTEEKEGVMTIPIEAYYADDGGDYCYLIKDGVVAKQYITIGTKAGDYVEVAEGLSNGDTVITDAVTDEMIGKKAESAQ